MIRTPGPSNGPATHYQVLGVPPEASGEAIRAAWRIQARRHHPDRHAHLGPEAFEAASEYMRRVTLAYSVLSDHDRRRHYDLVIGVRPARCSRCGAPGMLRLDVTGVPAGYCDDCHRPPVMAL